MRVGVSGRKGVIEIAWEGGSEEVSRKSIPRNYKNRVRVSWWVF